MAKVIAVREIALRGEVREEDFQRYLTEEYYPLFDRAPVPGVRVAVLKGDRGDRGGRYLHLIEFDSVETRDRVAPPPGRASPEIAQWMRENAAVLDKWNTFATPVLGPSVFTDYVEVGR